MDRDNFTLGHRFDRGRNRHRLMDVPSSFPANEQHGRSRVLELHPHGCRTLGRVGVQVSCARIDPCRPRM